MDLRAETNDNQYDTEHYLCVRGLGELAQGQQVRLSLGASIVVGRSRHCDWSLRRAPSYLKSDSDGRDDIRNDLRYNSVSRKHARVSYVSADMVEIENLSGNGTLVDGKLVDKIVLTDCRTETHRIQLGPKGVILELIPGSLPI
ncbi:MAG: FHA domain-containing protein [Planctomycetota bacterium]|nr:FHA domain-containing protein [Planctomycetota bacterium]